MNSKSFPWVSPYEDRHGKVRWRFRRTGYPQYSFKSPHGTKAFEREYAACLEGEPLKVGVGRVVPGSVSDVIARYYADNAFLDLRASTQRVYRGVLERFRAVVGDDPIKNFDAERVARLMTKMRNKPHAAARLRKLLTQLFVVARRSRLVPAGFDPVRDTRPPRTESGGYHRWTEEELATFERRHPLGTKPRLAFDLLLYGAQRSGDVRLMDRRTIASGRIRLDQSKTSNAVDVPIVPPLADSLEAGPLGVAFVLEANTGRCFTEKGFYNLMKRACVKAGLPHCSAHGLRKAAARRCRDAGCTDDEGMAITGHKTVKEYRRYAGSDARPEVADAAMGKVMANHALRFATGIAQATEKSTHYE